jgi:glutaredoxin
MSSQPLVELFSRPGCHLCEEVKVLLQHMQSRHPFTFREVNITEEATLLAQYEADIPVVFINGRKAFKYRVDAKKFVQRLQRAQNSRQRQWWQCLWHSK